MIFCERHPQPLYFSGAKWQCIAALSRLASHGQNLKVVIPAWSQIFKTLFKFGSSKSCVKTRTFHIGNCDKSRMNKYLVHVCPDEVLNRVGADSDILMKPGSECSEKPVLLGFSGENQA